MMGGQLRRSDHLVMERDAYQSFIESPMAQPAQSHTVTRVIIAADVPGLDMRSIYGCMPIGRQHADTAQCATMIVSRNYGPAKALVAYRRFVSFFFADCFFDLCRSGVVKKFQTVLECLSVDYPLFYSSTDKVSGNG